MGKGNYVNNNEIYKEQTVYKNNNLHGSSRVRQIFSYTKHLKSNIKEGKGNDISI